VILSGADANCRQNISAILCGVTDFCGATVLDSSVASSALGGCVKPSGALIGHSSPDVGCANVVKINKIEDVWHSEYNRAISLIVQNA
jgi:hypothetical protein